jgi:hypothetical protein
MRVAAFFLAIFFLSSGQAQNSTVTYGFDTDINGWSVIVSGTSVSFYASDGDPAAGSMILSDSNVQQGYVLSPCILIPMNTSSFSTSVNAKILSGISASFQVDTYSNSNCSGVGTPASGRIPSNSASWQTLQSGVASVTANDQGIQILLFADVGNESILFDHVVVQFNASTPVRLQNFNVE